MTFYKNKLYESNTAYFCAISIKTLELQYYLFYRIKELGKQRYLQNLKHFELIEKIKQIPI